MSDCVGAKPYPESVSWMWLDCWRQSNLVTVTLRATTPPLSPPIFLIIIIYLLFLYDYEPGYIYIYILLCMRCEIEIDSKTRPRNMCSCDFHISLNSQIHLIWFCIISFNLHSFVMAQFRPCAPLITPKHSHFWKN